MSRNNSVLAWFLVFVWMALIFVGSTDLLSSSHTSRFIGPLLRWFKPDVSAATIARVQLIVRKTGHLTEYAVLAILIWRAVRGHMSSAQNQRYGRVAAIALAIAALYAASDEFHQAFVVTRQASVWDVLIDSIGASVGLALVWVISRAREQKA